MIQAYLCKPTYYSTTLLHKPTPQEHRPAKPQQTLNLLKAHYTTYHHPTHPKWHRRKIQPIIFNSKTAPQYASKSNNLTHQQSILLCLPNHHHMTQTSMPIYNMVTKYHITRTVCGSNINKLSPIRSQPPLRIQSPLQHTRNMGGKHPSLWQKLDRTFTRKQHRPSLVDKLISTQEELTSCT